MQLPLFDVIVFLVFVITVISLGIFKSRHEKDSEGYFLAGRGLSWWLIGFSLIAANISTEQFVGMSGSAADYVGLAIASYEWMAAITLVVVAFVFLPRFLRSGIYTIPEFLEYRYNRVSRSIMSLFMMIIYVGVTIAAVIYSGALTVDVLFGGQKILGLIEVNIFSASCIIGFLAAGYVTCGGLKACAWADLLQGSALIVGGAIVVVLAMHKLGEADPTSIGLSAEMAQSGAIEKFRALNESKLHMKLPSSDLNVPWTALIVGLWIPNFYYWGLNQYIMQRTLGSKSLAEGQKGIVFAAGLKLLIPFVIVIPGIIAFNLYQGDMKQEATLKTNKDALAAFEKHRSDPANSKTALKFHKDFAVLYPETAREMVAFNSRAAGIEIPAVETPAEENDDPQQQAAKSLVATNADLIEAIGKKNESLEPEERIEIQQQLIGYQYDSAFALLIKNLIPEGLRGFMLAAILGAVMSSLASMLNAASTIFTMDIYKEYVNKAASQKNLVTVGRISVVVFVTIGCLISPLLGHPKLGGIFKYIQEFQGFISPGILAVFVFGLLVRKAPPICGVVGLLLNPAIYGILMFVLPNFAFLDRMAVSFFCLLAVMGVLTAIKPLKEPVKMPTRTKIELQSSPVAKFFGALVVIVTVILYIIFW
ncbi:MAG TPA: sodium/solute symporter [Thermoguttaceae bacterium]|nr:sodium/solute symporter [Thermoguttaceae bacterium]